MVSLSDDSQDPLVKNSKKQSKSRVVVVESYGHIGEGLAINLHNKSCL